MRKRITWILCIVTIMVISVVVYNRGFIMPEYNALDIQKVAWDELSSEIQAQVLIEKDRVGSDLSLEYEAGEFYDDFYKNPPEAWKYLDKYEVRYSDIIVHLDPKNDNIFNKIINILKFGRMVIKVEIYTPMSPLIGPVVYYIDPKNDRIIGTVLML